jgi:tartrate/fumarate subfamily iron-sulfur-dependent hydro-lyase beta chain
MATSLTYPFTTAVVRELKIGETVRLSGRVFTGRDRLHRYLFEGGKCPVDLKDGAIYHCGPVVLWKNGMWVVKAAGPTTSMREEPYMAKIIEQHHIGVIIGKGGMGEETRDMCAKCGCVYVHAVGGAASVVADRVEKVAGVHFMAEFGSAEAMWDLVVKDIEGVVTIDARGRSLHNRVQAASRRALAEILKADSAVH